jgi:hypothetical protein
MSVISWNEIRKNSIQFSREWSDATDERAEAQSFWNDFFGVYGIKRRSVASFEAPVKSLKNTHHRIDLFWKGKLLAEHKSFGSSLDKAKSQAFNYIQELSSEGRFDEIPRYVVLSDFQNFVLYDLEPENQLELNLVNGISDDYDSITFKLEDLHKHIKDFSFLIGQKTHTFREEDPANIEAAELMAKLHDAVEQGNYKGHHLEQLLVRMLFCLFAEDTGIFEIGQFQLYTENHTKVDGSDFGSQLNALFEILNTPYEERSTYLEEDLADFPYINGGLFSDHLPTAGFSREMRDGVLESCIFDWSKISPAIFGSLFQGIMDTKGRREIGAHYTSEKDILKIIKPLFLDKLYGEFIKIRNDRSGRRNNRLLEFQNKLSKLVFLDPACGCGNFLVIAYRELRVLEHDVLNEIYQFKNKTSELNLGEQSKLSLVDVDQFYGIEIGEWPSKIAETALWLTDHQMNVSLSLATGNTYQRIPLHKSPHIACRNALQMNWSELLPAKKCSYILGNPPFIGKRYQTQEQKREMLAVFGKIKGLGNLDYVTAWYFKSLEYVGDHSIECAFVSTNSICQGEQVGILWSVLYRKLKCRINFAHRTFLWQSDAKGKAHVHVVIIGFSKKDRDTKFIYEYSDIKSDPVEIKAENINPYLVDAPDLWLENRSKPISNVPELSFGNMPNDGGNLILSRDEKTELVTKYPEISGLIREFLGSDEFINGWSRYCFWLKDINPSIYRENIEIRDRIKSVKEKRLSSSRPQTKELASYPTLFGEIRQPDSGYLAIPKTSSENRDYIPIGFLDSSVIASTELFMLPKAGEYEFGILTSEMHMAWLRAVCGRLKSDYRYSAKLVYNNFPWPNQITESQKKRVVEASRRVMEERKKMIDGVASFATIYDPMYMPGDLLKAHKELDLAVDKCYRGMKFNSEREKVEFLFKEYQSITAPIMTTTKRKRAKSPNKSKHTDSKNAAGV